MLLSPEAIDAIETELFAILSARGADVPISEFTFQGASADEALRVLLPYQRLPVDLRRLRIQVRRPYGQAIRVVSVVDLRRPAEWLRPARKAFRRGARGRPFVPSISLGDVFGARQV